LAGMTDKELFNEAFDVCVRRAMVERQASDAPALVGNLSADASAYLGLIDQVLAKSRGGSAPSWMLELTAAHTVKKCQSAFRTFLAAEEPQEPAQKNPAQRVVKQAPASRHGDPLEQLPPWFAPDKQ
jgi:hypothetical protein